jgi:hypothetical protein
MHINHINKSIIQKLNFGGGFCRKKAPNKLPATGLMAITLYRLDMSA